MTPRTEHHRPATPMAAMRVFIGLVALMGLMFLDLASARAQGVSGAPVLTQTLTESFDSLSKGEYGEKASQTLDAITGGTLFNGQWAVTQGEAKIEGGNTNRYIRLEEEDRYSFVMALLQPAHVSFSFEIRTPQRNKDSAYLLTGAGYSSGTVDVPGLRSNEPSRRDSYQFDALQAGTYTFSLEVLDDQLRLDNARFDVTAFSAISAVPEPQGWAMLLAGIGAIGFLSRRRPGTSPNDLA